MQKDRNSIFSGYYKPDKDIPVYWLSGKFILLITYEYDK